jgi:hypothetical protein
MTNGAPSTGPRFFAGLAKAPSIQGRAAASASCQFFTSRLTRIATLEQAFLRARQAGSGDSWLAECYHFLANNSLLTEGADDGASLR